METQNLATNLIEYRCKFEGYKHSNQHLDEIVDGILPDYNEIDEIGSIYYIPKNLGMCNYDIKNMLKTFLDYPEMITFILNTSDIKLLTKYFETFIMICLDKKDNRLCPTRTNCSEGKGVRFLARLIVNFIPTLECNWVIYMDRLIEYMKSTDSVSITTDEIMNVYKNISKTLYRLDFKVLDKMRRTDVHPICKFCLVDFLPILDRHSMAILYDKIVNMPIFH